MPNRIRGEAALTAGGRSYRLLLTLGALAEIEDGLGLADLSAVAQRLKTVRAADLAVVAAALLRGGGHEMTPDDMLRLPCDLGALVAAVTDAFDAAGLEAPTDAGGTPSAQEGVGNQTPAPFAGATG